jgi:type 1 glutamine amidotransferase
VKHRYAFRWLSALVVAFAACSPTSTIPSETRKVVIVTGIDYPGHKWKETAPALAAELRQDPRLKVDIVETPSFLASPKLSEYDTVVLHFMNWETPDPGQSARENLARFVEEGGGMVAVHFACGAFQGWPEFEKLAGRVWDPNMRPHDPRGPFEVTMTDVEHPITAGMRPFETDDELYTCLAGETPVTVLAHAQSKVDQKYYAMAFVLEYGKGRVFHCPLGHDVKAIVNPPVAELFRRGCAWSAGLAPALPPSRAKRKKIVFLAGEPSHGEGNHAWDRDARLLASCLDRAANVEPLKVEIHDGGWPDDPADLDDADAIVFLADGREHHPLNEPGRVEKICALAEQGKGLVFLHYAIDPPDGAADDFLEWMGGCYDPGCSQNPINTVPVTPADNGHPITRGCGGFVAEDEWYFDIGFREGDDRVVPIMTGKLPPWDPQDKVLAWACTRRDGGRGCGYTGGHYHKDWLMETFRKVALNGILWAAKIDVPRDGIESVQPWRFVSIPDFLNVDLTYPQPGWEEALDYVLKTIKAENPAFVLVAGDLVMGRWPDKEAIEEYAAVYYPAWIQRMRDHELEFYAAIGDHEIGDNPWPDAKAKLVRTFKRQFQKYLKMPLNGPLRMKGTAFWFIHENTLFIAVDVFEKGKGLQGEIVPKVTGEQLEWLERVLTENDGVEHVVVMGHTPILGPVAKESSSGLMLEGGKDSPLWQTLTKRGVDLYLCGEVHAITCTQANGVMQVAHGGLFGYNRRVNYLVATVWPDQIELELKEIAITNEGDRLWQVGNNRPHERVSISDAARKRGFETVGRALLTTGSGSDTLKSASGCFSSAACKTNSARETTRARPAR